MLGNELISEMLSQIGEQLVSITQYQLTLAAVSRDKQRNNLSASKLLESINYKIDSDGGIILVANDYWTAIEYGLPRGTIVPIKALTEWAQRYRIKPRFGSFNQMIFFIQRAIIAKGTLPRPFVDNALESADQQIGAYVDRFIDTNVLLQI
jgi:hypothetical protein